MTALLDTPETSTDVKSLLEQRLEIFSDMCALSGNVEIDGITDEGKIKDYFKETCKFYKSEG